MVLCAPIMKTTRSTKLFSDAQELIPGGVNSPVRAFRSVGGQPRFITRAKGPRLYDVDGNSYIDVIEARAFDFGPCRPFRYQHDQKGCNAWNQLRRAD